MICFNDIFKKLFTDKKKLIIIFILSVFTGSMKVAISYLTGKIVENRKIIDLFFYIALVAVDFISLFFLNKYVNKEIYDYCKRFFDEFLNIFFSANFKEIKEHNEDVLTTLNDSFLHIRFFTESVYYSFFWRILTVIISVGIFFIKMPIISISIIISCVVIYFYIKFVVKKLEERWKSYLVEYHKFNKSFQNVMLNIWNIKYNSLEYMINDRLKQLFELRNKKGTEFRNLDFWIYDGPSIIFTITVVINLFIIIKIKSMPISMRVFSILQIFKISDYISRLCSVVTDKYQNIKHIEKICPVWLIKPKESKNIKIGPIETVQFKNVTYAFADGRIVVNNMNFTLKRGDLVSLSAKSGKGKSTIINLLCRLYDIEKGEILINGMNIKDIELESLRQQISVVPQTIILFNTSIKDNIVLDQPYNKKRLDKLVKLLNLPNINKNGTQLSHGQKQRVLIARVLYNDNKSLYIFDEALSAVDVKTAVKIHEYIINYLKKGNKIGMFISHNKSFENRIEKKIVL